MDEFNQTLSDFIDQLLKDFDPTMDEPLRNQMKRDTYNRLIERITRIFKSRIPASKHDDLENYIRLDPRQLPTFLSENGLPEYKAVIAQILRSFRQDYLGE